MSEFNISIPGGESKRLKTGGTYCPADILVTAEESAELAIEDGMLMGTYTGEYINDRITTTRQTAFTRATASTIRLSALTKVGYQTFSYCESERIELPNLAGSTNSSLFAQSEKLKVVNLGYVATIASSCFSGCKSLESVILCSDKVVTMNNVNAFNGTPFAQDGNGGKIYVPSSLIESYKAATNWSVLHGYGTCEFVAIEGSEFE
jgi:hypothetical protein